MRYNISIVSIDRSSQFWFVCCTRVFSLRLEWRVGNKSVSSTTIKINVINVAAITRTNICDRTEERVHSCANAESLQDCESSCGVGGGNLKYVIFYTTPNSTLQSIFRSWIDRNSTYGGPHPHQSFTNYCENFVRFFLVFYYFFFLIFYDLLTPSLLHLYY